MRYGADPFDIVDTATTWGAQQATKGLTNGVSTKTTAGTTTPPVIVSTGSGFPKWLLYVGLGVGAFLLFKGMKKKGGKRRKKSSRKSRRSRRSRRRS